MADFHQSGAVTTLHRLTSNSVDGLETELEKYSRHKPIGLVLPALYSEFERPAMKRILAGLREVRYLQRIVVPVADATCAQFELARAAFQNFYAPVTLIWIDSEKIQAIFKMLEERGLSGAPTVKGGLAGSLADIFWQCKTAA